MEPDFSGYVTKAGLKCSDGRTIMPNAFQHQDKMQVPLVWQHGHKDAENILGHVLLENRDDGVYGYGFFNGTVKAKHAKEAVSHGDINAMSIWANDLIERAKRVMHGAIREVSLVLSGANPGALIDNIVIQHDSGDEVLDDSAIIYTGLSFQHDDAEDKADGGADEAQEGDATIEDVYNSMTDAQKNVCHYLIGEAMAEANSDMAQGEFDPDDPEALQHVLDSMNEHQQEALVHLVGDALSTAKSKAQHNNLGSGTDDDTKGNQVVKHNVFESDKGDKTPDKHILSHSDVEAIVESAKKGGSLKAAVEEYALAHGIEDIDVLFPEARNVQDAPELFSRRMEWVSVVLAGVKKSPFSRIKTLSADITVQEARAKGYITGSFKKEEFFKATKRVTTPTTIYKKQKLDREDIIDITDFDVVMWLKGEMRIMLDEELARAILMGDGRDPSDEDKVDEEKIRPIATDSEVYTTTVNVNLDDANSSFQEVVDAIVANRQYIRGTGIPTLFTTETWIAKALLLKDTLGRRIYNSLDELATELRVTQVVPVQALEEYADIVAILVNLMDYTVGADQGGEVSLFDFFDIDYNQYKYLIETRASGALTKLKAALVVRKVAGTDVLVTPNEPVFDGAAVTITNQTGVVYRNVDTDAVMNAAGSPYAVAEGTELTVHAEAAAGYDLNSTANDIWVFRNNG